MKRTLLLAIGAALLFSLAIDAWLTRKYGGVDLRDKVVGARSLLAGRSIYFAPWRPGEDERFADPMVPPGARMTRYTGTPFQALVMAPLGALPFGALRLPWLIIQYALLLLAAWLAFRAFDDGSARAMVLVAAVLAIVLASGWWRLHVERGQVYVAFAALLAALFWSLRRQRLALAGALAAALILLKPTYALLLLPLVLRAERRMLLGGAGLALVAAGAFALLPNGLRAWAEYAEAMRAWSGMPGMGAPPSAEPRAFEYPAAIEGLGNLREHHAMEFENGSIAAVLLGVAGKPLPGWLPYAAYALLLAAAAGLIGKPVARMERERLLLLGFCAWTVLMVLLPTPRFDYQLVHWVAPALFLLLAHRGMPFGWNVLGAGAALMAAGGWAVLPVNALLAEALLLCMAAWALLRPARVAAG